MKIATVQWPGFKFKAEVMEDGTLVSLEETKRFHRGAVVVATKSEVLAIEDTDAPPDIPFKDQSDAVDT